MLLKDISLYLNVDEYERNYGSDFEFRARYICNFLRRHMVALKLQADGFGSIAVQGRRHVPADSCPIQGENVAVPSVFFDQQRYEALGPGEHHEFFIGMLLEGLETCARHHEIPLAEMKSAIEDFRRGGYRNEWTHQKRMLRPVGLQASLLCGLDTEKSVLTLKLESRTGTVFERAILETKPDEVIFAHRFKDVVLEDDAIVVKNKFGKPTFTLELSSLT